MRYYYRVGSVIVVVVTAIAVALQAQRPDNAAPPAVVVDDDGTVHVPAMAVPQSVFLSPEAKAYVTQHLKDMQRPIGPAQNNGVPGVVASYIDRQKALYAVNREDTRIAGVHAYIYTPKSGVADSKRVLINLHGGGFSGCWPACAELESIPIAALARARVVSLDYRQGPTHKFPA